MKLHLHFTGQIDLDRPEHMDHLRIKLGQWLHKSHDCAEAVIWFDEIEYYLTYMVKLGDDGEWHVECFCQPRTDAECVLNARGYTTREPYLPSFEEFAK